MTKTSRILSYLSVIVLLTSAVSSHVAATEWPANLPVYDHIVLVVEENKDFEQILGPGSPAKFIKKLAAEGASFTKMFAEEHFSQGNYFWLFSGSNQDVGFKDVVPKQKLTASNLGEQLIKKARSFKGYAESLPSIGWEGELDPPNCHKDACVYARKHVPWISFDKLCQGNTVETSCNLRFADFPTDFSKLPTVAFVTPNLNNDMHNRKPPDGIKDGDKWLEDNLGEYYKWAKTNNSLLIVNFDENDDKDGIIGLTNPMVDPGPIYPPVDHAHQRLLDLQNRVVTIFAGAHIKPGNYEEGNGITHVNILRTIEAMYGLGKSGKQQTNALAAGIGDDQIITDVFVPKQ
jgi:hypothetical protein